MRFIISLALLGLATSSFAAVDAATQQRMTAAVQHLGTPNVTLGVQSAQPPTNPYTAVYSAQFFYDASSNFVRRLSALDASSQFNPVCTSVPAGVIAYQPVGGGMIYSYSPDPSGFSTSSQLWKIDPQTCGYTALTSGSPFGATVTGANFSSDGRLWFVGPGVLYQVSTATGGVLSTTTINQGSSATSASVAFDQNGAFYLTAADQLYTWSHVPTINPAPAPAVTTNLTALLASGTYGQSVGLAFGNLGNLLLYAQQTNTGTSSTTYAGFAYTPSTGQLVQTGTVFGTNTGLYSASSYPAVANLSLTMTLNNVGQINPGAMLPWTVTINNAGPGDAVNGQFTVTMPSGLQFVPSTAVPGSDRNCTGAQTDGATVTCNISIGAGQVQTLALNTQVDPAYVSGVQTMYAQVTVSPFSTIATPGNNSGMPGTSNPHEPDDAEVTYVVGPNAHIASNMTGSPYYVWQGNNVTYTIQAINNGPNSAPNAVIKDTLPAGLVPLSANASGWSCSVAGQAVTCTNSFMGVSQTATVTIVATANTQGTYTNSCSATSSYLDPSPSTTCSAQTVVRPLPTSAPPLTPVTNTDQSCPLQFTGNLALKELDYSFTPSATIGGVATVTYPPSVYMEGGEFACYTTPGDLSTKVSMPLCTFDQAAGQNYQTTCPITTSQAVAMCAMRGFFRSLVGGQTYPLTYSVTLYGQPNTTSTVNVPMEVVDPSDYIYAFNFESRQRPQWTTGNCQYQ